MMATCYIGVGSNLGDRQGYIDEAASMLKRLKNVRFVRSSPVYETDPVSKIPQAKFLNCVFELETGLSARGLLHRLKAIEDALGRVRGVKDSPRTIDLDILIYGDAIINDSDLVVPHPRMHEREFVLRPLSDLAPEAARLISKAPAGKASRC